MRALQIRCFCDRSRTCEFVVKENRFRIKHHPKPSFPETHAVVRLFVISGLELFIKPTHLIPEVARCQEKGARTVVHVASEHICRGKRIVAAAIPETRSITPDDATGLLKCAVEKDEPSAYSSDVRAATKRSHRGTESARL